MGGAYSVPHTERIEMMTCRLLAASGLLAMALLAPIARADSMDDQFLGMTTAQGIPGTPETLIADAHETCDAYGQGKFGIGISPYQAAMIRLNGDLSSQGLSPAQMSQLMRDAITVYCPEWKTWP
jgi:hypothetical protein